MQILQKLLQPQMVYEEYIEPDLANMPASCSKQVTQAKPMNLIHIIMQLQFQRSIRDLILKYKTEFLKYKTEILNMKLSLEFQTLVPGNMFHIPYIIYCWAPRVLHFTLSARQHQPHHIRATSAGTKVWKNINEHQGFRN